MTDNAPRGSWGRALWAAVLSLIAFGLGHIFARSWRIGVARLAINGVVLGGFFGFTHLVKPAPSMIALVFVGYSLWVACVVLGAMDAARQIRRFPDRPPPGWLHSTWLAALVCLPVLWGINAAPWGWRSFNIASASNEPTLITGDYFFVDARDPGASPERGDMMVFRLEREPSVDYVKRIIGLPGDRVAVREGRVYINGVAVARELSAAPSPASVTRYVETLPNGRKYEIAKLTDTGPMNNTGEYHVPADRFFTLGDSRDNSVDSRSLNQVGLVPRSHLRGKVETIYWARDMARLFTRID